MSVHTGFELFRGLEDLSNRQPNLLSRQFIQLLEGVFNIRPSEKFLQICFCSNMIFVCWWKYGYSTDMTYLFGFVAPPSLRSRVWKAPQP